MGNLHYNWGPDSGQCTATSNSGCSAGSAQLHPLRGCSAVCSGATSGGFALYCGDSPGGAGKGAHCGVAVACPDSSSTAPDDGSIWVLTSGLGSVSTNTWHHIAATYIEGEMKLYVNGVERSRHTFAAGAGWVGSNTIAAFTIGGRNDPTSKPAQGATRGDFGFSYFNGLIDELRIWNDVRNQGQIMIDMLDTPCGYRDDSDNFRDARDPNDYCLDFDPLLLGYFPFDETPFFNNASGNVLVGNAAKPRLGEKTLSGSVSWSPQELVNGTSYMDRTVVGSVSISGSVTTEELEGGKIRVLFTPAQTGTLVVTMTDANPADKISIGDLPFFPALSGVPQEIIFDSLGYRGCCLSNPCSFGGPKDSCAAAYCGGAPGCPGSGLIGARVSRMLEWTPVLNSDWVVPPGGFPVIFHATQHPAQPLDLSLTPPERDYQYGPVYLDVQLPPEFVAPTPDPLGVEPINMTGYLGEELTATIKAQQRNQEQQVDIWSADDPGMPNAAVLSVPNETKASIVMPFTATRVLSWIPQCSQAGKAKLSLAAINRQIRTLRAEKHFEFTIIRPQPMVVDFDASARIGRIGCGIQFQVHAMDARNESNYRPSYNSNYLQTFTWTISRKRIASAASFSAAAASSSTYPKASSVLEGLNEGQEELPLQFPGVVLSEREPNEFR